MDPTVILEEQRQLVKSILDAQGFPLMPWLAVAAAPRLAELVQALDTWLCIGGRLPVDWGGAGTPVLGEEKKF